MNPASVRTIEAAQVRAGDAVGSMAQYDQHEISALIVGVSRSDHGAFDTLYDKTSSMLFGVCLVILRDRREAEEALQEVFFKVWRHAGRYCHDRLSATAWLRTIARNESIGRLRTRKRALATTPTSQDFRIEDIADPAPSPEANLAAMADAAMLTRCFEGLSAQRAELVRGAYLNGDSYAELAHRHQIPVNTIRTWLRRSLAQMRASFELESGQRSEPRLAPPVSAGPH